MDIIEEEKVSIKQKKYSGSFEENLYTSQEFVNDCTKRIQNCFKGNNSFLIRPQDDKQPLRDSNGKFQRASDIEFRLNGKVYFVECKDFAQCVWFSATGLSVIYVEKIKNSCGGGVILLFRDNMAFVEEYATKKKMSQKDVIEMLKKQGHVRESDGKIEFIPYGESLSVLMNNRNYRAEEKVPCRLPGKYDGSKQNMWNLGCMDTIENLMRKIK